MNLEHIEARCDTVIRLASTLMNEPMPVVVDPAVGLLMQQHSADMVKRLAKVLTETFVQVRELVGEKQIAERVFKKQQDLIADLQRFLLDESKRTRDDLTSQNLRRVAMNLEQLSR